MEEACNRVANGHFQTNLVIALYYVLCILSPVYPNLRILLSAYVIGLRVYGGVESFMFIDIG